MKENKTDINIDIQRDVASQLADTVIKNFNTAIKQQKLRYIDIAKMIGVSEKTISNWLRERNHVPITLENYILLAHLLQHSPDYFFPEATRIKTFNRTGDMLEEEQLFLDLEKQIEAGSNKSTVWTLFAPLIQTRRFTEIFMSLGHSENKFREKVTNEEFWNLRQLRIERFKLGSYNMQNIFMRDEYESFVKGIHLFSHLSAGDKIEQLEYIKTLLETLIRNNEPRLSLKMSKWYFRALYDVIDTGEEKVVILNTNNNCMVLRDKNASQLYVQEFENLWQDGTYPQLNTRQQWIKFLDETIDYIRSADKKSSDDKKRKELAEFSVKTLLGIKEVGN